MPGLSEATTSYDGSQWDLPNPAGVTIPYNHGYPSGGYEFTWQRNPLADLPAGKYMFVIEAEAVAGSALIEYFDISRSDLGALNNQSESVTVTTRQMYRIPSVDTFSAIADENALVMSQPAYSDVVLYKYWIEGGVAPGLTGGPRHRLTRF